MRSIVRNITVWNRPNEIVPCRFGPITYREWCERERDRMTASGRRCEIKTRRNGHDGFIALCEASDKGGGK